MPHQFITGRAAHQPATPLQRNRLEWLADPIKWVENFVSSAEFSNGLEEARQIHGPRYHVRGLIDIGPDHFTLSPSRLDNSLFCRWGCRDAVLQEKAASIAGDLDSQGWTTVTHHPVKDTISKRIRRAGAYGYAPKVAFGATTLVITNKPIDPTSEQIGMAFEEWLREYGLASWLRTRKSKLKAVGNPNGESFELAFSSGGGKAREELLPNDPSCPPDHDRCTDEDAALEAGDDDSEALGDDSDDLWPGGPEADRSAQESVWRRCEDRLWDNIAYTSERHPNASILGLDPFASSLFVEATARAAVHGFALTERVADLASSASWSAPEVIAWRRSYRLEVDN